MSAEPVIEARAVSKSFGGVEALKEASFRAFPGEVHALVGENGAGKSTLIKIIGGRLRPDRGTLLLRGEPLAGGVDEAHRRGCWTVFQELTLLPSLTVAENLLLRREPRGVLGLTGGGRLARAAEALMARFGITHIDPRALIEDLALAERQVVEIVRALSHDPAILLLDEPTSALMERETAWLFGQVKRLRAAGTAVVFTSHRWSEIERIANRITVFRGGRDVGSFTTLSEEEAVTLMTGQKVETLFPKPLPLASDAPPLLEAEGLAAGRLAGLGFTLRAGEILGIGGLAGHGHRELFLALYGALGFAGRLSRRGRPVHPRTPRQAIAAGIALVPEDRKTEGLLLSLPVRDNLTLTVLGRLSRLGVIRRAAESRAALGMMKRLAVRAAHPMVPVGTLSGGNQQKVLLGRALLAESEVLLFYDVTRGVDVATKHEIYLLMMTLAASGRGILFYSSDTEELAHLCHRVLVLREGRLAAELAGEGLAAGSIIAAAVRERVAA